MSFTSKETAMKYESCLQQIALNEDGLNNTFDAEERQYYQEQIDAWYSVLQSYRVDEANKLLT